MASTARFIGREPMYHILQQESHAINRTEDAMHVVPTTYACYFIKQGVSM